MNIVIVGSGVAGCSAAAAVREGFPGAVLTVITTDKEPLYSPCVLPHYLAGRLERKQVFIGGGQDLNSLSVTVLAGEVAFLDPISRQYRPFMLWHRAREEGRTAGYNASGGKVAAPSPVQRVVVNIGDSCFAALGYLPDDYDHAEEYYIGSRYFCLVYNSNRLVHIHSVNDPCGPGFFSFLLGKKGKTPARRELLYRVPVLR